MNRAPEGEQPPKRPLAGSVDFFFDFISPYSFLAAERIARAPHLGRLPITYRPVTFGTMLARREARGPGEDPQRRRRGLEDLLCLADFYGIPVEGPPTHPFNSVYAARSVLDVREATQQRALTHAYFRAAWIEGQRLDDLDVLRAVLARLEIDQDPELAAAKTEHRKGLKKNTEEAIALGAPGVPTFVVDDLVFFGHDRLELLAAFVEGRVRLDHEKVERMLARPQPGRIL